MIDYEKLGAFYLGKRVDADSGALTEEPILYDSKDLTTHGMCVGMTGSGKTGLCLSLIEEAAIDGVPVLAIDPKGDLGNLMLTFPNLLASDFEPWIDPGEAARKGRTPSEHAAATSKLWREGLASWQQDGDRIKRLREAAECNIYTPGSKAGLGLSVLRGFNAPPVEVREDHESFSARVQSTASSLLALLSIDTDPLRSREHIFVSNVLTHHWRNGTNLSIADLIRNVQEPPFRQIGVMDVDLMFPAKDRFGLAMALNGLLASPAFAAWGEGEPLDIQRLLYTENGKPRVSVISIAHLPEDQRMFFVTLLLTEVVTWMRQQAGTSSLRALVYMDEVFGFLPPTANPPSKLPMMTLLKQARAYGVGVMLATQNPVDLDYKALSNMGTWFLGRLQTERDKMRVIDGLEGASAQTGAAFDRASVERMLSGMEGRRFLLHNVHDDGPVLLHTRWAMSYLRGPMTRSQIERVMQEAKQREQNRGGAAVRQAVAAAAAQTPAGKNTAGKNTAGKQTAREPSGKQATNEAQPNTRPVLPSGVGERFQLARRSHGDAARLYKPALYGTAVLHYISAREGIDEWREVALVAPLGGKVDSNPWDDAGAVRVDQEIELEELHDNTASFSSLPVAATQAKAYKSWRKKLADHLYRSERMQLLSCRKPKLTSSPGESEGDFRARLGLLLREARDLAVAKLQQKYEPKLHRLQERRRNAEQVVQKQRAQRTSAGLGAMLSVGTSLLGSLFGRRKVSTGVGRAIRGASRVGSEHGDVKRAQEDVKSLQKRERELDEAFQRDAKALEAKFSPGSIKIQSKDLPPRKSDIDVNDVVLLWTPWATRPDGDVPLAD